MTIQVKKLRTLLIMLHADSRSLDHDCETGSFYKFKMSGGMLFTPYD